MQAVEAALGEDQPSRALILSLRLNEDALIKRCIVAVPPVDIRPVVASVPFKYLNRLIQAFAELLENCPHLEFILRWCQVLYERNSFDILLNVETLTHLLMNGLSQSCFTSNNRPDSLNSYK